MLQSGCLALWLAVCALPGEQCYPRAPTTARLVVCWSSPRALESQGWEVANSSFWLQSIPPSFL